MYRQPNIQLYREEDLAYQTNADGLNGMVLSTRRGKVFLLMSVQRLDRHGRFGATSIYYSLLSQRPLNGLFRFGRAKFITLVINKELSRLIHNLTVRCTNT